MHFGGDEDPGSADVPRDPRLAYRLDGTAGGPLVCLEATSVAVDGAPSGVLSRWGPDASPDALPTLLLESSREHPLENGNTDLDVATGALRGWLSATAAASGTMSLAVLAAAQHLCPDVVGPADGVLVVDGVPLPGTVATSGALTARVVRREDHTVTVVHTDDVRPPVRVVRGMPVV